MSQEAAADAQKENTCLCSLRRYFLCCIMRTNKANKVYLISIMSQFKASLKSV